jgi:hypothetical protein
MDIIALCRAKKPFANFRPDFDGEGAFLVPAPSQTRAAEAGKIIGRIHGKIAPDC